MKVAIFFICVVLAGGFYLHWLNEGCELAGVMTWEGKQCID
jgi:hypothetical protein